jgi:hypothetical protein
VADTTNVPPAPSSPALSKATALVLSAVLGVLALVLILVFAVRLLSTAGGSTLGDETFDANASVLADQVSRNGPILFPDLLGQGKDIYVQHLSPDRKEGWLAFRATAPGAEPGCTLRWQPAEKVFSDPCQPGRTYPPDGRGLEQYRASVEGANKLVVDLRRTAP